MLPVSLDGGERALHEIANRQKTNERDKELHRVVIALFAREISQVHKKETLVANRQVRRGEGVGDWRPGATTMREIQGRFGRLLPCESDR